MQPQILVLNKSGLPFQWASVEDAIVYNAKGLINWSCGEHIYTLTGGVNRATGERSSLTINSIIGVKADYTPYKVPGFSRDLVFRRDRYICAYCGQQMYSNKEATLDHINPKFLGGKDSWMNLVTACKYCNHKKAARTPEQAKMKLLYVPYEPNRNEAFILKNRRILADQMDFLINSGLSKHSRILRLT